MSYRDNGQKNMKKVYSDNKYDYYVDKNLGDTFYNVIPKGEIAPVGGYKDSDFICKIKGVSNIFKTIRQNNIINN